MRGRVSKIEIYAKFLHTRPGPSCSSLSRLISPRVSVVYTVVYPRTHRATVVDGSGAPHRARHTPTGCGAVSSLDAVTHAPHHEAGGRGA